MRAKTLTPITIVRKARVFSAVAMRNTPQLYDRPPKNVELAKSWSQFQPSHSASMTRPGSAAQGASTWTQLIITSALPKLSAMATIGWMMRELYKYSPPVRGMLPERMPNTSGKPKPTITSAMMQAQNRLSVRQVPRP